MGIFECGFAGADKDIIRIYADLGCGWSNLGSACGFDKTDFLEYGEAKFKCRLRLIAKAATSTKSAQIFHERYVLKPVEVGRSLISLHGLRLQVDIAMGQVWFTTQDQNRRPIIYETSENLFSVDTPDGPISYRMQLWVVLHGQSKMFVRDQYEHGDGFAWIGGRPESNRRKF
jgi:hypothetical protein